MDELSGALERLAGVPRLLVALDFDGVLAPLVDEPSAARPLPRAADAVRALAGAPGTTVVLLSGRGRDDLRSVSGFDPPVRTVGSHGGEYDPELGLGDAELLTPEQTRRRDGLVTELSSLVDAVHGARLEHKPGGAAVHVRGTEPGAGAALLERVRSGPGHRDGVDVTEGKDVLDLAVLGATKGSAVRALRRHLDASAVLFAGDDVTDETAFAVLEGPPTGVDVGIKVGDGDTAAGHRVASPGEMADVLARLAQLSGV